MSTRHARPFLACAALAAALIVACREAVAPGAGAPDDYQLPEADRTLDPSAVRVGSIVFACQKWSVPPPPANTRMLVDIHFGPSSGESPETDQIEAVERHGGRVLYQFRFQAVRARIDAARIPALASEFHFLSVRDVPDPRRFDWPVIASFVRPVTDADVERFAELGGQVRYRFTIINALAGPLPDRSIDVLRGEPEVSTVNGEGVGCLA